jgi:arginyl-tRNA synthetase
MAGLGESRAANASAAKATTAGPLDLLPAIAGEHAKAIEGIRLRRDRSGMFDASLYLKGSTVPALTERLRSAREIEVVRPDRFGYRLRFRDDAILRFASGVEQEDSAFLKRPPAATERCIVVFCDPNATKALHLGHMRIIALGDAIGSLLEFTGSAVVRQSIVCDTGRSVAEMVAGYLTYHRNDTPRRLGLRSDVFGGMCYSDYARSALPLPTDEPDRDAVPHDDGSAAEIMTRWYRGDTEIVSTWRRLRRWVLGGHDQTFERLGVRFDSFLYESDSLQRISEVTRLGLECGVLRLNGDSSIDLVTGLPELPTVPMVRADGFETGYMRNFAIWHDMQRDATPGTTCVNIMGDEWVGRTVASEGALQRIVSCPLYDCYHRVGVGTVRYAGQPIKSRRGDAPLIDDCLDRLCEQIRPCWRSASDLTVEEIAVIALKAFFLDVRVTAPIEFCRETILDDRRNPAWTILRAWTQARNRAADGPREVNSVNTAYRFVTLQALKLPAVWQVASTRLEIRPVIRHLWHLADAYLAMPAGAGGSQLVATTLTIGLNSIGLLRAERRSERVKADAGLSVRQ